MASRFYGRLPVYFFPLFLFYLVTVWGLWHIPNSYWGMYGNIDGRWFAWNLEGIFKWGHVLDLSPFNLLSGMGSMFAPYLPWLNPGALSLALPFARELNYLFSYTIYFAELCVSTTALLRVLGFSPLRSVIGAQLYLLILFPPSSAVFGGLMLYSLVPVMAHLAAVANLILALFVVLGQYRLWGNLACAVGMLFLTLAGLFSGNILFLPYVLTYGVAGTALLIGQRSNRPVLFWKLGAAGAIGMIVWLLGFPAYLEAMAEVSARSVNYPPPLRPPANVCFRAETLLCKKYPIFWFHVLASVGATIQLFRKSLLRPVAAWFLLYYAFIHLYEFVSYVSLFGRLHVISTPYLVWSAYPFFALFFVLFAFAPADLAERMRAIWRDRRPRNQLDLFIGRRRLMVMLSAGSDAAPRNLAEGGARISGGGRWTSRVWNVARSGFVLLIVPALAYYLWAAKISPNQPGPGPNSRVIGFLGPSPVRRPAVGPVTRYLIEHAGLKPGRRFRGYTVTYFGDPAGHIRQAIGYRNQNMSWDIYIRARWYLDQHYGNRFQEMDLWEFGIPTLEEYGQWVTRQAYAFVTELFSSPGDAVHPVVLHIYKLDIDLLRALGVRFLIADFLVDDVRLALRAEEKSPTAGPIYLHEIADSNLGTYSPTRPMKAATFAEAVATFRQHKEVAATDVVVFDDLVGPFVPARNVEMRARRDGFRVRAESDGHSLLLLPVQFSRCFRMKPAAPGINLSSAHLLRANGVQTLLEFRGRIDALVEFEFGLFGSGRCRLQDARELRHLGLKK